MTISPGLSRGWKKGFRTILQMATGGALTALVGLLANGLSPGAAGGIMVVWSAGIAFVQNYLEGSGKIPILLPTPSLVSPTLTPVADGGTTPPIIAPVAAGTVDAVITPTGEVVGAVTDLNGDVVGTVTGELHSNDDVQTDDEV